MAYDEADAERIRQAVAKRAPRFASKPMFGGIGFMVKGNLAVGIHKGELLVRVAPEDHGEAARRPHASAMSMRGKPIVGWVMVKPAGWRTAKDLGAWVDRGVAYASSKPTRAKKAKPAKTSKRAR